MVLAVLLEKEFSKWSVARFNCSAKALLTKRNTVEMNRDNAIERLKNGILRMREHGGWLAGCHFLSCHFLKGEADTPSAAQRGVLSVPDMMVHPLSSVLG